MGNKIKMNVNEEMILRKSIQTDKGVIVINNMSQQFKQEMLQALVITISKNEDFDEKEIMLKLIDHCTNVEFEGDLFEAQYLSHEAQIITNEILIIFQELIEETYQLIKMALKQSKTEMLQKEILREKDEIVEEAEKIEDEKEKNLMQQKETTKKPPRRRKK